MNIERLANVLRDAARAEILPRFRRLDEGMVRTKTSAMDLVTEADEAAERAITASIAESHPQHVVIGEEAVSADPGLLERRFGDEIVLYIDPIDGTANYAAGVPLFAVMAAVVRNGETVAGVIYDPMGDDWVMAERGCGAWQIFPDGRQVRMKFADPVPLSEMAGTASVFFLPAEKRRQVLGNLSNVRMNASYRCAGHEYRMAAAGHLHYLMFNKLMPWDHLAGTLITQEAGAHAARFDGSPYLPAHREGGLLIASDRESWDALRREVFTV
ncbi:inositol monophosphatase family protein [Pelagibacterium limicola]|uniref:inositol monophosphatase family protein n=1 Tax=Pelagibacterium limicola TaxID=2791022 RepID=UPI0018B015ED|nr:inositol monophosphatase [Pelagibacterium limicola]